MESRYDPKSVDAKWYRFWEEKNFFTADPTSEKPPYCIVMPPPNVTGVLHMGHALVSTLQDILVRWKRMQGFETLWVPGIDHAGIATQTVVERELIKRTGRRRKEFAREEFLGHVWNWKEANEQRIVGQLKMLGCSCDWSRYRFTMDEAANRAVRTIFKRFYDRDLIYQGDYLVNWDPVTQTALADEEIETIEREGSLWHIRYGELTIATTRPETMLGDTAVAVHPDDPRYSHLIGTTLTLPIVGREIPIIADKMVAMEFGTGAVKITPAHDSRDYQLALRHDLPMINLLTPDAHLNENAGDFAGMSVEEGRAAIVERLKAEGYLVKVEPYQQSVSISYRSKAVIEPYISKQWFVRMDSFKKRLREVVERGEVRLIPDNWKNTYFHWIDNLRDWCISRQLWWGHQIPIWRKGDQTLCYDGVGLPPEVAAEPDAWQQDPDALDTWFSSGLWPLTTLGWPEETPELKKFYPNSVLITGHDILFFWVARMILMGEFATETPPFPETFMHGLIYGRSYWRTDPEGGVHYCPPDERIAYDKGEPIPKDVQSKWEKLSKSKGNVIDPVEIIDEYGTDAMRMALCASAPQNRQIDLDRRRFEEFRNFTNKIWNGARFVLMQLENFKESPIELQLEDRWILAALRKTILDVNHHLERYAFDHAATAAYDFFWKEFCAYYVEIAKRGGKEQILAIVLCSALRLLHPMAPFITEELFHLLKERVPGPYTDPRLQPLSAPSCMVAPFPTADGPEDREALIQFGRIQEIVYAIRNIRGELKVPPHASVDVTLVGVEDLPVELIPSLVRVGKINLSDTGPAVQVHLPEAELAQRVAKEREKLQAGIERLRAQLNNESFVANAPPAVVEKTRANLADMEASLVNLQ